MRVPKKTNESTSIEPYTSDAARNAKSFLEKIMGEVSKTSAMKQIVIGSTSGWATGFISMKIGKITACAVGGGIIMLQIAAHHGYIKINWDKIMKKAENITDKVEEKITGEGSATVDKVIHKIERFLDKKLEKSERLVKQGVSRTRRWYHTLIGEDDFQLKEFHFFVVSFAAGVAIGMATAN
ncbi:FUN14 domain-containing protein 1A isoform X1 [Ooceraea biroi]|nr:FUN14 domain-containing protein 1A isoform X1 [Ooceraea biroi]XP_011338242.1 FUN14 domain-containing protein 1A isoform X1 [Ooceraea biroi]XP_011338243.1 FUN14 domain-containing protein 1A isoform X1 [Ooceraea biroi]